MQSLRGKKAAHCGGEERSEEREEEKGGHCYMAQLL